MKILIVNGYSKTEHGKAQFAEFEALIKQIFKDQRDFVDTETEFVIRTKDNLDDFLFELDSSYVKVSAAKYFDHVDMVFIEGDANLLPWSPSAAKMLILLRMCLKTKKLLFASSFAMQALVFLSATNFERNIIIVNGNGKGGSIAELMNLDLDLAALRHHELFLDNVTGDLYSYNYDANEWVPKANIGLHYKKAAQGFESLGKFIVKCPVYKSKQMKEVMGAYLSKNTEDFCYLKKIYLQHWALTEMEMEFVVPAKNAWDIHQFNFVNASKSFIVIAESRRCPQVIVFDQNCIACMFNITKKYIQTTTLLKNFIFSKLKELRSMEKPMAISIEKAAHHSKGSTADYFNFQKNLAVGAGNKKHRIQLLGTKGNDQGADQNSSQMNNSMRPKTANEIVHSGLAFKRHDGANLIVENNAVGKTIDLNTRENKKIINSGRLRIQSKMSPREGLNIHTMAESVNNGSLTFLKTPSPGRLDSAHSRRVGSSSRLNSGFAQKRESPEKTEPLRINSFAQFLNYDPRITSASNAYNLMERAITPNKPAIRYNKSEANFVSGKGDIRRMLYPDLPKEFLNTEEQWIPGTGTHHQRTGTASTTNKIRIKMDTTSSRFYSTFNKFKDLDIDEGREKPCISTASEYLTEEQRLRRLDKERTEGIIGNKFFKFAGKGNKPSFIKNYVNMDFSAPPSSHKYREVDKSKWVAGKDMRLCG
jgi:hypothetical protein